MANSWTPDFNSIPVDQALTLVVAWREGQQLVAGKVNTAADVTTALRGAARSTIEHLGTLERKVYSADAHVAKEEYMAVPLGIVETDDQAVFDAVKNAAGLPLVGAHELPNKPLYFYAVTVGEDPEARVGFVRKSNPRQAAKPGHIVTTLGDTLSRLDRPVFIFDQRFDLIILPAGVVVINQTAFEFVFREAPGLVQRYPEWVEEIAAHLPFAGEGGHLLGEAASRDSRIAKRLRAIHERGHLKDVSVAEIRKVAKHEGLDPDALIKNGQLVFDPADRFTLLKLLNEDLFTGGLSGERFEVEHKSRRV